MTQDFGDEAAPPSVSYNAAWRMRHKLMQVMMERDREHPARDAYLGGERAAARGRGAPGKTPFVVQTNEQGHPLRMKLTVSRASVSPKSPPGRTSTWLSDGLACFHAGEPVVGRSRGRAPRVSMGEYDSRQHQERLARHLPCDSSQVCSRSSSTVSIVASKTSSRDCLRGAEPPMPAATQVAA